MQQAESHLSKWLFIYASSYTVMHIVPAVLPGELLHKLMLGDVLDLLTPFVLLMLVFILYKKSTTGVPHPPIFGVQLLLIIGAVSFVEGHGMHLAANAIFRHLDTPGTPLYQLTYFFDETLGHILWDAGLLLIAIGLILASRTGQGILFVKDVVLLLVAALLYGFTYFVNAVEGQTVLFTLPAAILIPVLLFLNASKNRVALFFAAAFAVADLFFLIWWMWQGGFPQFSELGWI